MMMTYNSSEEAMKTDLKTSCAFCTSAPMPAQDLQTLIMRNLRLLSTHNLPRENLTMASLPVLRTIFFFILASNYRIK